jgi:hypothetical protein
MISKFEFRDYFTLPNEKISHLDSSVIPFNFVDRKSKTLLVHHGPNEWSSSAPDDYSYQLRVKYMGDHTWLEVDEQGNPVE